MLVCYDSLYGPEIKNVLDRVMEFCERFCNPSGWAGLRIFARFLNPFSFESLVAGLYYAQSPQCNPVLGT